MNEIYIAEILNGFKSGKKVCDLIYDEEHNYALNDCIRLNYLTNIVSHQSEAGTYLFKISHNGVRLTDRAEMFLEKFSRINS